MRGDGKVSGDGVGTGKVVDGSSSAERRKAVRPEGVDRKAFGETCRSGSVRRNP